jgi:tetratricopeptide (TPR) repeat protein
MTSLKPTTILILSASPRGQYPLRLDEERRDIENGLERSQRREQFQLVKKDAVRTRDVHRAMLEIEPQIVHFCGHGEGEEGLIFEDEVGQPRFVDGEALAELFSLFSDQLKCVVLNACYSEVQVTAISQHIPYVIGMSQKIGDKAAIEFAVGFYDALGAGRDIEFAFKLGCSAIRMAGIAEHLTPILKKTSGVESVVISKETKGKSESFEIDHSAGIPQNLPYSGVEEFVGREEELARLHDILQRENSVSVSAAIAGMGGIGKTELALQYARKYFREGSYPGGICWLRATEEVGTQIISFARSCLDLTIRDDLELPEKVTWCLNRWREKREGSALLIFDDVQKYEDVRPFLKDLRFKVLITTRSRFGSPVQELPLDVLQEEKALELLRTLVKDDRINQQLDQAKQLCEWLGYLPLGVEVVGRYLYKKPDLSVAVLWQRLQDKRLEARVFKQGEPGMTASLGVVAAFELSWQALEESAHQVAVVLSLFALAEIPWAMVEQCLPGWDAQELEEIRDEHLLGLHLLKRVDQQMYQLHQLLKEFFATKREQWADVRELKRKFYDAVIAEAQRVIEKPKQSLFKESTVMIAHLKEAIKFLKAPEREIDLATCLTWLGTLYHAQGQYSEAERCLLQALTIREQQLGHDHLDVAENLSDLGIINLSQGRDSEAEPRLRQALEIRQHKLGSDDLLVASSLNNLAEVYKLQKHYSEAEPRLRQALEIRQQKLNSDHPLVALSLHNLAQLYYLQKRYNEAEPLYEEALRIRQRKRDDNHPDVARSLNDLGLLRYSQERYNEAEPLYEEALRIRQRHLGDNHPDVAPTLHNLGLLYYWQQRYREAETSYLKALRILLDKLGENHSYTQKVRGSFRYLLQKVLQENRSAELSDDQITRSFLEQIRSELEQGNSDGLEQG